LPILLQSALIPFAGDTERAAMMMRNQTTKRRHSSAQFFLGGIALALTADPVVLLARCRCRSRLDRVACPSIEVSGATCSLRQWAWYDVSILPARLQAGGVVRQHNDSQQSHHLERDEQGE
jgi:hypothetical protein